MRMCLGPVLGCLTMLCLPATARAGAPVELDAPEQTPHIQGGQNASACEWPTTVALFNGMGLCSGTLVHPRVVTSAAHCMEPGIGGYPNAVRFGEDAFAPAFNVPVDFCLYNPGWNGQVGASDYAFCVLSEAVDLPPTPPMMGCELEQLEDGAPVVLAGFGNNSNNGGAGPKRWGNSVIVGTPMNGLIAAGNMDVSTCSGDSGGTGYFQMPDGGWRSWGMLSGGPEDCGNEGYYVNIAAAAAWIEEESGFDITPCHDADGTWNPGPDCLGVATNPAAGGNWNQGCPDTLSDEPATCGPGVNWPADVTPPEVSFTNPTDGQIYPDSPVTFDIVVDTEDDGFAVVKVELYIDGEYATERTRDAWADYEPWVFANAELPKGIYEIGARAYDYEGNEGEAAIVVYVDEEPGDGDGDPAGDGDGDGGGETETESGGETETESGGETEAGEDTETGTVPGGLPTTSEGCNCSQPDRAPGAALFLPLLLLGLRRRD